MRSESSSDSINEVEGGWKVEETWEKLDDSVPALRPSNKKLEDEGGPTNSLPDGNAIVV